MSRSVASPNTIYAGTPRSVASSRRNWRSDVEQIPIDAIPRIDRRGCRRRTSFFRRSQQSRRYLTGQQAASFVRHANEIEFTFLHQKALADELLDPLPHLLLAEVAEKAPGAELVVAGRNDSLVARAGEHLRNVIGAVVLAHTQHARQNLLADDECIVHHLELAEANVARIARPVGPRLAEVLEQTGVTALNRLGVVVDFVERRDGRVVALRRDCAR